MARTSDLKTEVIKTSTAILNSTGYGALTISEIADRLEVSKQRVYYHFPGAEELVIEIAHRWSESGQLITLKALADTKEEGFYRIKSMAEGMFDWVQEDPELAKVGLVLYQLTPQLESLRQFMDTARDAARNRIETLLKLDARFLKAKRPRLDAVITTLHSQMYGSFLYFVAIGGKTESIKSARTTCLDGLERMLTAFAEEL